MAATIMPSPQTPRLTIDSEQSRLLNQQIEGQNLVGAAFMNLLSQKRRKDSLRQLTDRQIHFFNDKSILENQFGQDSQSGLFPQQIGVDCLHKFGQWFDKSLDRFCISFASIPLIHPQERIIWDCVHLIAIIIWFVLIPLHIALPNVVSLDWIPFLAISLCVFFVDVLISLNTSFYSRGKEITTRGAIARHYVNTRLFYDLVTNIPIIYHVAIQNQNSSVSTQKQFFNSEITLLLFFLKYFNYTKIKDKIEESFNTNRRMRYKIDLLELLFAMLMLAHVYACVWVYLARFEQFQGNSSWVNNLKEDSGYPEIGWHEYVYAYYFATITMVTVGYGDIVPTNLLEIVVATVFVLITCGMFAFTLNSIGHIIAGMNAEHVKKNEVLQALNKYMKSRKVSMSLQYSIREYVEYYFKESLDDQRATEERIFSILSETLKKQLLLQSFKLALKDSPIFRLNFSESTIEKTIELVTELHFNPEQIVYSLEDTSSDIYFIERGEMEILINHEDCEHGSMRGGKKFGESKVIHVLKEGGVFGELEFFTGQRRHLTVRSKDFSTVLRIERAAFMSLLSEQQEDHEKFCFIRDSLINRTNYQEINVSCYACQSKLHIFRNCPLISFQTNRLQVIRDYVKSEIQTRTALPLLPNTPEDMQIEKRRLGKINSCAKLAATQKDIENYVQNNEAFIETYIFYQMQNATSIVVPDESDSDAQTPESHSESDSGSSEKSSSDSSSEKSEKSSSSNSDNQEDKLQSAAKSDEENLPQNVQEQENESSGSERKLKKSKNQTPINGMSKVNMNNSKKLQSDFLIKDVILSLNQQGQGNHVKACSSESDPRSKANPENDDSDDDDENDDKLSIQKTIKNENQNIKEQEAQKLDKKEWPVTIAETQNIISPEKPKIGNFLREEQIESKSPAKDEPKALKISLMNHKLPPLPQQKNPFNIKKSTSIKLEEESNSSPDKQGIDRDNSQGLLLEDKDTQGQQEAQLSTYDKFKDNAQQLLPLQFNVQSQPKQQQQQIEIFKFDTEKQVPRIYHQESYEISAPVKLQHIDSRKKTTTTTTTLVTDSDRNQQFSDSINTFNNNAAAEHAAEHAAHHAATGNSKNNLLPIIYQSKQPTSMLLSTTSHKANPMIVSTVSRYQDKQCLPSSQNSMLQSKVSIGSALSKKKRTGMKSMLKSEIGIKSHRQIPIKDRGSGQYRESLFAIANKQQTEEHTAHHGDKKAMKSIQQTGGTFGYHASKAMQSSVNYLQPKIVLPPGAMAAMAAQMNTPRHQPHLGNMGTFSHAFIASPYPHQTLNINQAISPREAYQQHMALSNINIGQDKIFHNRNTNNILERPVGIDQFPIRLYQPNGLHIDPMLARESNQFTIDYTDQNNQFISIGLEMFDLKKEYQHYFPHNNATRVIAKYNKQLQKKIKERETNNSKPVRRMSRKSFAKNLVMKFSRQTTMRTSNLQIVARRSFQPDDPIILTGPNQLELNGQ